MSYGYAFLEKEMSCVFEIPCLKMDYVGGSERTRPRHLRNCLIKFDLRLFLSSTLFLAYYKLYRLLPHGKRIVQLLA